MIMIGAVDANWAIGYRKDMLIHLPLDLKRFRELTTGNIIIIGRKTLESFPQGKPLKDRVNIVITSDREYNVPGAVVVHSIEEAVTKAEEIAVKNSMSIFVAGGGQIYEQMEKYCTEALVTYMYHEFEKCDTYFPNLDDNSEWELVSVTDLQEFDDIKYEYRLYKREDRLFSDED